MNNQKENTKGEKRTVITFWNKHKRKIKIIGGIAVGIGATILTGLGVKYLWDASSFERWFKKAPLDELKLFRNDVHSEYMKHNTNDEYRETLWNLLPRLDKRIWEIENAGKSISGPAYHREHGYNLYKPD